MPSEEVKIKTGVDNSALKSGMVQAEDIVRGSGTKVLGTLKSIKAITKAAFLFHVVPVLIEKTDAFLTGVQKLTDKAVSYFLTGSFSAIAELHQRSVQNLIERLKVLHELNKERWKEEADQAKAQIKYEDALRKIAMDEADEKGKIVIINGEVNKLELERHMLMMEGKKGTAEWIELQTKLVEKINEQKKAGEAKNKSDEDALKRIEKLNKERFEREQKFANAKSKNKWDAQDKIKELTGSLQEKFAPGEDQLEGTGHFGRGRNKSVYFESAGEQVKHRYENDLQDYQSQVAQFGAESVNQQFPNWAKQLDTERGDLNQFRTGQRQNVQEEILKVQQKSQEHLAEIEQAFKEEK